MTSYAKIVLEEGRVYSPTFDDIYYNREDGRAESRYVFMDGNGLPQRWRDRPGFCIAETGFGTGLNFLLTLEAWLGDPSSSNSLHYVSIEAYPLHPDQLAEVHRAWPELKELSRELIAQYPRQPKGNHVLLFAEGGVQLQLIFEDVAMALSDYRICADSWYLDGFAPSRNPEMWRPEILRKIAEHSAPKASLATFTADGEVRSGLADAGFEVRKRKGFGRKREMLCAAMNSPRDTVQDSRTPAWFELPDRPTDMRKAGVIGAGIAGAQIAWHLAQRGIQVFVFETQREPARGASGNPAGVLAPRLTAAPTPSRGERFYLSAFYYQLRQLRTLQQLGYKIDFDDCGLLQLAYTEAGETRIQRLAQRGDLAAGIETLSSEQASDLLGEPTPRPAVWIPEAGALSPRSLVKALLGHRNIQARYSCSIEAVNDLQEQPELCLSNGERLQFDAIVLANGAEAADFCDSVRITPVRGQTSSAYKAPMTGPAPAVDHAGYLVHDPRKPGKLIFGATYLRDDSGAEIRETDTRSNLDVLAASLPQLHRQLTSIESCHAGIRATTPDRWPVAGPLADTEFYLREYADLHMGKRYKGYPRAHYRAGIYMLSGLGSRGLASAAYCARLLSHIMLGLTLSAPLEEYYAMHPARFLVRNLRKRPPN